MFDRTWKQVFSELLVNISAFWFVAAFGVPALSDWDFVARVGILILDIFLGMVFLLASVWMRKWI